MPNPIVHPYPVKRPNYITEATWLGGDDDLALQIKFPSLGGTTLVMSFQTRNIAQGHVGEICQPASTDLSNLGPRARDVLVAHLRMACMIAGLAVPGSKEFETALIQADSNDLQTALGTTKVTAVATVDDQTVDVTFKRGTGPNYVVQCDHGELNSYVFVPDTQLLIVPGSVKKQFPTYVHDYPNAVLSAQQKADVANYVLSLSPWI